MMTPARQDRIVDAVVASLTEHAEVRLVQQSLRGDVCLLDVMDNEALFRFAALRTPMSCFSDQALAQAMPRCLRQVGSDSLMAATPIRMRRAADRRKVSSVAGTRAEVTSRGVRIEGSPAGIAESFCVSSPVRAGLGSQGLLTHSPACSTRLRRPERYRRPARSACRVNPTAGPPVIPGSTAINSLALFRAADLRRVRRIERFGADRAGFQHAKLYHIQIDKDLIQDSVMAASIAAYHVVHVPPRMRAL